MSMCWKGLVASGDDGRWLEDHLECRERGTRNARRTTTPGGRIRSA